MEKSIKQELLLKASTILFIVLMSFVAMWLWNWLMPIIFGLPQLNYWQTLGLQWLAKILFPKKEADKETQIKALEELKDQIKDIKRDSNDY